MFKSEHLKPKFNSETVPVITLKYYMKIIFFSHYFSDFTSVNRVHRANLLCSNKPKS